MHADFLRRYLRAFDQIPGWFSPDAYLLVAAYHQLLADEGLTGEVLEIGVYHGLSAIGFAALREPGKRFVAIDLFEKPNAAHGDESLFGSRECFMANMARFYDDVSFITAIAGVSAAVRPADLGAEFALCHVDGGHTAAEVYADIELCAAVTRPGGLVVLDDFSAPAFPGVAEAALRFHLAAPGTLRPIALGFNKAVFQRQPAPFDLNARFAEVFPHVASRQAAIWDLPVPLFDTSLQPFFDTSRSTPRRLAVDPVKIAARIEPVAAAVTASAGATIEVPVSVTNLSRLTLSCDNAPFGLSYHLFTAGRALLKFSNDRAYFTEPLVPGASRLVNVSVRVPVEPGQYHLEFDVVWEGVLWMKDTGNPTAAVALTAVAGADDVGHSGAVEAT